LLQHAAGIADQVSIEPAGVPENFRSELVQRSPLRAGESLQQVERFIRSYAESGGQRRFRLLDDDEPARQQQIRGRCAAGV
jgi:hypothetical protein